MLSSEWTVTSDWMQPGQTTGVKCALSVRGHLLHHTRSAQHYEKGGMIKPILQMIQLSVHHCTDQVAELRFKFMSG